MSEKAAAMEYAPRTTYGSVAYDLNRLRRENAAAEAQTKEKELRREKEYAETKVRTHTAVRAKAAASVGVSAFSVVGILVTAALIALVLLAYVQLTALGKSTTELQDQISSLTTTQEQLKATYESTFNLASIEDYAKNNLGMVEPTASQITNLNTDQADSAVVVQKTQESTVTTVLGEAADFLNYLLSYFQ